MKIVGARARRVQSPPGKTVSAAALQLLMICGCHVNTTEVTSYDEATFLTWLFWLLSLMPCRAARRGRPRMEMGSPVNTPNSRSTWRAYASRTKAVRQGHRDLYAKSPGSGGSRRPCAVLVTTDLIGLAAAVAETGL